MRTSQAPWPTASNIVEKAIQERHERIHHERVEKARSQKTIDNELPERCLPRHDPKKELAQAERRYEIEAENARLYQKLSDITDMDSSKIIQPATSRSTILSKPGMYVSDVGGHLTIDHINMDAGLNPGSLHYTGRQGKPGSASNSRGPSPLRASVNGGPLWNGRLMRASASVTSEDSHSHLLDASGELLTDRSGTSSIPLLPPISRSLTALGTPPRVPGGTGARSRGPSPSRSMDTLAATNDSSPAPRISHSSGVLYGRPRPPMGMSPSRHASPAPMPRPSLDSAPGPRAYTSPSKLTGLDPHPPMASLSTPPKPPSQARASSRGPSPMRASLVSVAPSCTSRGASPLRGSLGASMASLPPSTGDWRSDQEQRKAVLASVYLTGANLQPSAGAGVKAIRRGTGSCSGSLPLSREHSTAASGLYNEASSPAFLSARTRSGALGEPARTRSSALSEYEHPMPSGAAARRYSATVLDQSGDL